MKRIFGKLYVQVLIAVILGAIVGVFVPETGTALKPLGDAFIKLIKMLLAPVIFLTVVTGIARMENMKELGRVGFRALIYFEVVSTLALVVGLVVVDVFKPGAGMNIDVATLDTSSLATYTSAVKHASFMDFVMNIIPDTIVDAFAKGNVLQILLFSILLGIALAHVGPRAKVFVDTLDSLMQGMFRIVNMVMRLAPIGAFGAIAFTIGKYGFGSLFSLGKLMACVYLTCAVFVIFVLGPICRYSGFSLWKFLKFIKEELFTVLGTSSSESVLPQMISKMEKAGVSKPVAGHDHSLGPDLQPGRAGDLLHHRRHLHRAGHEHTADPDGSVDCPGRADVYLQGLCRCHRLGIHHSGGDVIVPRHHSGGGHGAAVGRRPVHVGSASDHQHHRQWRRDNGHCQMGRGAGHRENAQGVEW